jgi:hypothetical protein
MGNALKKYTPVVSKAAAKPQGLVYRCTRHIIYLHIELLAWIIIIVSIFFFFHL